METIIEIFDLSKKYSSNSVVNKASFTIESGSIHGFLGPNGAGKSTTMKILAGIIPKTSGEISLFGKKIDYTSSSDRSLLKSSIGYLPEDPPLYTDMLVIDFLKFVARINGRKSSLVKNDLDRVLHLCNLHLVKDKYIGTLSKGFKQRVGIAQALIYRPPVIILDEPVNGLDPQSIKEMRQLFNELKKESTIFLSTHLLHEAELLCEKITIINQGNICFSGRLVEMSKRIQTRQIITCDVKYWCNEFRNKIMERLPIEDIERVEASGIRLRFFSRGEEDIRSELAEQLIAHGAGVLSLQEEQASLENIFDNMMQMRPQI